MFEALRQLFGAVCGQGPAHTWAPGGWMLPCCQRCTGLYAGACLATLLHLWLRPHPAKRSLWFHGLLLLQMIPFGFHWLPQGPILRTVTGILFGFGLVHFLWLTSAKFPAPASREAEAISRGCFGFRFPAFGLPIYLLAFGVSLIFLPAVAETNSRVAAVILSLLATGGLCALAVLAILNLSAFARAGWRVVRRRFPVPAQ